MGKTNFDIIIGIDPDVDRNGFAVVDMHNRQLVEVLALTFPDLLDTLHDISTGDLYGNYSCRVIVEAGWLNQGNWHVGYRDSKAVAAAKGNNAGRNHEVGRKIIEMCQHWDVEHRAVKPLNKMWQGKDRKITARELNAVTGWKARTNQEMRDAALLAWTWAGLPIRISKSTSL